MALGICNHQFGLTFRFFVRISEALTDVNLGFQREIGATPRDVGCADVMKTPCGSALHQFQNIARPANVHPKDLFSILLLE